MAKRRQTKKITPPEPPKVTPKLIAVTTVKGPNRKMAKGWIPGAVYKPGQEIPLEGLDQTHVDAWLDIGAARWSHTQPRLQDIRAMRPAPQQPVVGSRKESDDEKAEFGRQPHEGDAALRARLDALAAEQAERGVDDEEVPEAGREVDVNVGTGDVEDTGDPDDEDAADTQVTE